MNVREFNLLGSTDKRRLESAVIDGVRVWAEQWLCGEWNAVSATAVPLSSEKRNQINYQSPVIVGDVDNGWCAVVMPGENRNRLISAMFTEAEYPASGTLSVKGQSILTGVVIRALGELGSSLCDERIVSKWHDVPHLRSLPVDAAQNGSGAYVIAVQLGDMKLIVAMSHLMVRHLINATRSVPEMRVTEELTEMSTFASVLANRRVRAEALLGTVELSIAQLASLNIGDVVRLDKSVDEPSELLFPQADIKCRGFVGQSAGRRALSLTKK